ncbi:MAG: 2,4-dihydroxyhept-2-ene-1,7-dioic acid aldolase [Alphaproteobacteria bacterium 64-11]|nr:2,4-dihydroxyhept-2-ene-1,7-dioic acid aldolase [Alphaproteobacteria bacterium]OJU12906.1 MAG: 2,4-dihydroxyhept-2-ene-1,7-dioic acid aldolase [Alphaproteobacteria bacterium 64-11]
MRPNRIRQLWAEGKPALNCWITLPGTLAAEMLAHQGWDSLTVDMQHGHSDFAQMCAMFAAISTTDTVPLMRVAWNAPGDVMRALDAGAYGVICPNIDTPEDCEKFVGACHYPPAGYRSFGPKRGLLYGGPDYVLHANETILTIVQIETRKGLENLEAIAAVPGLDMLYVGPSDLGLALGREARQNQTDPVVVEAIERILGAAKRAGLHAGMHCAGAGYAREMVAKGFDFVTVTSDEMLLSGGRAERAKMG